MPYATAADASTELSDLLRGVNLSATSTIKFNPVKAWVGSRIGLPPSKVAVFYVSDAGNLLVRFNQPSVRRDEPVLGFALVPREKAYTSYFRPAERLVTTRTFEAMAVCSNEGGVWTPQRVFARKGISFDPSVAGFFDASAVTEIEEAAASGEGDPADAKGSYDLARFEDETGIPGAVASDWIARLRRKGQIVVQGPPGTGKSYVADRLGRLLVGDGRGVVDTVQFHPAYGYEDFVAGLAPVVTSGGALSYEVLPGRFLAFCELAREAGNDPCVLVIDEFNRADVSRVFGELMHLLEYREKSIRLANGPEDGRFAVPKNVYVIATMNTADRSLALLDHALRRRFSFVRLGPDHAVLERRLRRDGIEPAPLLDLLADLNREIADPDFEIGISFFMVDGPGLPAAMASIWDGEILPYVREIMHAKPDASVRWSWEAVRDRFAPWYPPSAAVAP